MGERKLEVFVGHPNKKTEVERDKFLELYEDDVCTKIDTTVLGFCIQTAEGYHEFVGMSGHVLLENARAFIQDLKNQQKSGNGKYGFEDSGGTEKYNIFDKGDTVGKCLICNEEVKAEDELVSFPEIKNEDEAVLDKSPLDYDAVHQGKCLKKFIDQLETALSESDAVSEGI